MKIKTVLVTILMLMVVTAGYAQSTGDVLYNQGVELQKTKNVSSQQKAIETFQKAKVAYQSSDNKAKCDTKIGECKITIDSIRQREKEKKAKENGDVIFNLGIENIKIKEYLKAQQDFQTAKDTYLSKEDKDKCQEQIDICTAEIDKQLNEIKAASVEVVEKNDFIRIYYGEENEDITDNAQINIPNKKDQYVFLKIEASQNDWSYSDDIPSWLMLFRDGSKLQLHVKEKNRKELRSAIVTLQSGEKKVSIMVFQEGTFFPNVFKKKK